MCRPVIYISVNECWAFTLALIFVPLLRVMNQNRIWFVWWSDDGTLINLTTSTGLAGAEWPDLAPNGTNRGLFTDQMSVHFDRNLILKIPYLSYLRSTDNFTVMSGLLHRGTIRAGLPIRLIFCWYRSSYKLSQKRTLYYYWISQLVYFKYSIIKKHGQKMNFTNKAIAWGPEKMLALKATHFRKWLK